MSATIAVARTDRCCASVARTDRSPRCCASRAENGRLQREGGALQRTTSAKLLASGSLLPRFAIRRLLPGAAEMMCGRMLLKLASLGAPQTSIALKLARDPTDDDPAS